MLLVEDTLKAVREVAKNVWHSFVALGVVLLVGLFLISARAFVIANSQGIARHASTYSTIFTMLFTTVDFLVVTVVKTLVGVIDGIVKAANFLFGAGIHYDPQSPAYHVVDISTKELEFLFNSLPQRCEHYNNAFVVTRKAAKGWLHSRVCPIIRATWPIPWLWDLTNGALGWLSYDATPIDAWGIDIAQGNCEVPDVTDWFCAGLGSGYVLVEILVPIMMLIVLFPMVKPIQDVIAGALGIETKKKRKLSDDASVIETNTSNPVGATGFFY